MTARSIPPGMVGVLDRLEEAEAELVTTAALSQLLSEHGVATPARVVAARLRARGWLLPTDRRGVWEFAPHAFGSAASRGDPLTPLKAWSALNPTVPVALTFQAGAWAHNLADRVPVRPEIATPDGATARRLPGTLNGSAFVPVLPIEQRRGAPTLAFESILVHMAEKPNAVRSWASALEWLPDLAAELRTPQLIEELTGRPRTVAARAGYLLQGLRPDLAHRIHGIAPPQTMTWFGPRGELVRHDSQWRIADTVLPFDPRNFEHAVQ